MVQLFTNNGSTDAYNIDACLTASQQATLLFCTRPNEQDEKDLCIAFLRWDLTKDTLKDGIQQKTLRKMGLNKKHFEGWYSTQVFPKNGILQKTL